VQELVDAGMLGADEAESHESANLITRAVGANEEIQVDIVSGDARRDDQFLLASDGLTRVIRDEELAAALQSRSPTQAADDLIEMVLARGAPDNVSLIITKLV
jgi:serine/threonine protein phosphatase PrpC